MEVSGPAPTGYQVCSSLLYGVVRPFSSGPPVSLELGRFAEACLQHRNLGALIAEASREGTSVDRVLGTKTDRVRVGQAPSVLPSAGVYGHILM